MEIVDGQMETGTHFLRERMGQKVNVSQLEALEHVKNNFELFNYFSIILLIFYELHVHIDIVEIQ